MRFGSLFPAVAFTTSVMTVPMMTPVFTATPTVNVVEAALAKSGLEQVMVPVLPTAGAVQVQPEPPGKLKDWNVVFAGIAPLNTALSASNGPLFVTVCV